MVYIIDDDLSVRRAIELFLESAGLENKCFESTEAFLEVAKPAESDLLVLDMNLPGMSGCEFLQYLNKNEMNLPVIIITAFDEQSSRDCAKKFGAIAYLRKPIDGESLLDFIKYSLSHV
jgi:FixJ family two-component response regulator